jgi:hypothetical protein
MAAPSTGAGSRRELPGGIRITIRRDKAHEYSIMRPKHQNKLTLGRLAAKLVEFIQWCRIRSMYLLVNA